MDPVLGPWHYFTVSRWLGFQCHVIPSLQSLVPIHHIQKFILHCTGPQPSFIQVNLEMNESKSARALLVASKNYQCCEKLGGSLDNGGWLDDCCMIHDCLFGVQGYGHHSAMARWWLLCLAALAVARVLHCVRFENLYWNTYNLHKNRSLSAHRSLRPVARQAPGFHQIIPLKLWLPAHRTPLVGLKFVLQDPNNSKYFLLYVAPLSPEY